MVSMDEFVRMVLVGAGATVVMDIWSLIQKRLGVATLDFAMVGRWAGHLCQGKLAHVSIGKASPIYGERPLGWTIHYAVGIAFAALLVGAAGVTWLHNPTWLPAVAVGVATVAFPFLVMQPAMGAGIAASRTLAPWANRFRSLLGHAIFGVGLYLSARLLNSLWAQV